MWKKRVGTTLIEIIVVVVIIGILLSIVVGSVGGCSTAATRQSSGERNAVAHAQKMGWKITGAACSAADSDHDGYVGCTLGLTPQGSKALECGYDVLFAPLGQNTGCKDAMPLNINQGIPQ